MEHAVHVSASKIIESVSPAPSSVILKRIRNTLKQAQDGNENPDLDQVNADLATLELESSGAGGNLDASEFDDDEELGSGDAVGKALALVKQVGRAVTFVLHTALLL